MCRTLCTIEMRECLISMSGSDIINHIITSKPRLNTRFGLTMVEYDFSLPPPKVRRREREYRDRKRYI